MGHSLAFSLKSRLTWVVERSISRRVKTQIETVKEGETVDGNLVKKERKRRAKGEKKKGRKGDRGGERKGDRIQDKGERIICDNHM